MNPEAMQQVIESSERLARAFTGALHKTPGEATLKRTRLVALSVMLPLLMVGTSVHARYPAPNEGVGGAMDKNGKPIFHGVQVGEKIPHNFYLEVTNVSGHSTVPVKDNAITHLAEGLAHLGKFDFPFRLLDVTRAYLKRRVTVETNPDRILAIRGILRGPPDPDAIARFSAAGGYSNALVHHLRGHHARRRPCRQRATAARQSHRELPHAAGRQSCGRASHDRTGASRRPD